MSQEPLDQVTLVDENDVVLGSMDKFEAHRNPAQLHRASSVFLFRENERTKKLETIIQRRSEQKIVGAGWWANACCGNLRPNESYEECAHRRLREELGIPTASESVVIKQTYVFRYQVQCNAEYGENEMDAIFVGRYAGDFACNPSEVAEATWVSFETLSNWAKSLTFPTPAETLEREPSLDFAQPLIFIVGENSYTMAPWTIMMLRDDRLVPPELVEPKFA